MQHAAGFVHQHFLCGIEAAGNGDFDGFAVFAVDDEGQVAARFAFADHVVGFRAVQLQGVAVGARFELQRQDAHADEVGAVDALETFGGDGFHTRQPHALRRPVAAGALSVVRAGDDDERLFAVHVGFDGFPHAHGFAFGFDAGERALAHAAVFVFHHFVKQFGIGESRALGGEVVAAVGGVGIEVFFGQTHFRQVFACRTRRQNRVGRRNVVGSDVVGQNRKGAHSRQAAFACQRAFPIGRTADVGGHRAPVVQRTWGFLRLAGVEHRYIHVAELLRFHIFGNDGIDFFVGRPDVFQADFLAVV